MPTNCSAAKQLPQFCKHSKSADLLRKSLLSHVWRVPSSKALSCKHERLFDLLTLASYYKICQTNIHTNASNFIIKQSLRDNHIFDCLSSSVYLLVLQIIHYYSAFDFANIAISPTPFKTIVGRYAYILSVSFVEHPERTSTVDIPLSIPEITSVSILSPTMTASAE